MSEPIRPEQKWRVEIPSEVDTFINTEAGTAERETAQHLDEESAEAQGQLVKDLRRGEYFALKWLEERYKPEMVLYPGSGSDSIPKYIFGEDKVIHISLEEYAGKEEIIGKKHLEDLGEGMKTIADVESLPLENSSVDLVVLLESTFIEESKYIEELTRVIKSGGVMLLSRDFMFYEDDEERELKRKELMSMSDSLTFERAPAVDYQGEDINIEYYILRKK